MDKSLLDAGGRVAEKVGGTNSSDVDEQAAVEMTETHYRELAVEKAAPPLRVKIEPPVEYDGQKYGELILDFDSMIGKDFQRAEREFSRLYKADRNEVPLPEVKHLYHAIIAAHLADVPLGVILKLPRRYYVPLRTECLKACGSSPDEEKA
jgi:hypothetical protein